MNKKIRELLNKRAEHVESMHSILNKAEDDNRDLDSGEQEEYNKLETQVDQLKNRADRLTKADEVSNSLDNLQNERITPAVDGSPANPYASNEYKEAFYNFNRSGRGLDVLNALQVGTATEGGNITPESFETALVMIMNDINDIRQYATVINTASDRNIPIENTLGTANYTAEEASYTESDAAFGTIQLVSHKMTTIIKVSEELLEDSFFNLESYLATNFGKRFGIREETAFVAGTGSGQPTGIVTGAADSGITFATATAITSDELIDLEYGLAKPYRKNAVYLMNDATIKLVRKLKDADGQYIWQRGMTAGAPDVLFNHPVISSVAMPLAASANKSVVFGDLSGYTIADRTNRVMQRLNEKYADTGQIGFRMFERHDGKITDASAIVYAKQAV